MANNAAELRIKPVLVGSLQEIFGPLRRELSALGSVRPFGSPGGTGRGDIVAPLREIPKVLSPVRKEMQALVVQGDVWAQKFGAMSREVSAVAKEQAEGMNEGRRAVDRVGQSLDNARESARRTKDEIGKLGDEQEREMAQGRRSVDLLARSYRGLSDAAGNVRNGLRSVVDNVFSIRGAMVGVATGMAGRTLFDMFIGSNARLEKQKTIFRTMLGDAEKAEALAKRIESYAEDTPYGEEELFGASRRLLRASGGDIDRNEELLRIAGDMTQLRDGSTVGDAAEALMDLMMGEGERMKEYGVKLTQQDIKRGRRRGESLGDAALRMAIEQFQERGVIGLAKEGSKTFQGMVTTLADKFGKLTKTIGESAFKELKGGLDDAIQEVDKLRTNPKFLEDMEKLGDLMGDAARYAAEVGPQFLAKIPDAARAVRDTFREAKAFYDKHPRLVQFLVGAVAANKLTGGLLVQAGGAALRGGVGMLRRRAGGGVTSDAFETVADAAGGSCCCCDGMGSPGVGGKGGGAAGMAGRAAAGALTAAELGAAGLGTGAMVKGAAMGAGALALPAALFAMGMKGWSDSLESGSEFGQGNTIVNRMTREDLRANVTKAIEAGDYERAHGLFVGALGGPGARFGGSAQERESLQEVRRVANNFGMDFDLEEGQNVNSLQMQWLRSQGLGGHFRDLTRRTIDVEDDLGQNAGAVMSGINRAASERININITMTGTGTPEDLRRAAEEGARAALDRGTRTQRARK